MRRLPARQPAEQGEDAVHAEQRQGDDEEAGDGAAAHRDLDRLDEAPPGRRRGPDVGLDADVHADDPRRHRAGGADDEGEPGPPTEVDAEGGGVGDLLGLEDRDHGADDEGPYDGEDADRRVLAPDERHRTLEDGPGHVLHRLCPGVSGQDVAGQVDREQDGDDARRQDDQLKCTGIHQGLAVLLEMGCDSSSRPGARGATRERRPGRGGSRVPAISDWGGTLQAVAECNKAREAGSNSLDEALMHPRSARRRRRGPAPILPVL